MKILYSGFKNYPAVDDFSFEHINFYLSLKSLGEHEISYLPLDEMREKGPDFMADKIKNEVLSQKPDIYFFYFNVDLDRQIFAFLKKESKTVLVGISTDDHTDFYHATKFWGPCFDYFVSFYPPVIEEYKKNGTNIIGINYAANTGFYHPIANMKRDIDVSFIGAAKKHRVQLINRLSKDNLHVRCFGNGWPNGSISYEQMIEIFNRSRINLNLGQEKSIWRWQTPFRIFLGPAKNKKGFRFDMRNWRGNLKTILNRKRPLSRARPYEITACGGFTLTNRETVFGEPFIEGKEIAYYDNPRNLVEKISYYLSHEEERAAIAKAGYERTTRDHSFQKRFRDIISQISLKK